MAEQQLEISTGPLLIDYGGPERRGTARIYEAFPVKVSGTDASRQAIEADVLHENLSASGLFLYLPQKVEQGGNLSVIVHLSTDPPGEGAAARVAADGVVVRVEPRADGYYGLAVAFQRHSFL